MPGIGQQVGSGPAQGDFLMDLLSSSYTRHAPGTGDLRHDTEGWRCLETSFKVIHARLFVLLAFFVLCAPQLAQKQRALPQPCLVAILLLDEVTLNQTGECVFRCCSRSSRGAERHFSLT